MKVEEAKRSAEATALLNQRHWEWEEWCRAKEGLMEVMGRREGAWHPRDASIIHHDTSPDNATNTFRRSIGSTLSKIGGGGGSRSLKVTSPTSFPPSQLTMEMQRYVEVVHSINMRELRGNTGKIPGNIAQEFVTVAESVRSIYPHHHLLFPFQCIDIETIYLLSSYLRVPSRGLLSCKPIRGNC